MEDDEHYGRRHRWPSLFNAVFTTSRLETPSQKARNDLASNEIVAAPQLVRSKRIRRKRIWGNGEGKEA